MSDEKTLEQISQEVYEKIRDYTLSIPGVKELYHDMANELLIKGEVNIEEYQKKILALTSEYKQTGQP